MRMSACPTAISLRAAAASAASLLSASLVAAALAATTAPARAQDEEQFGRVHFPTSCNELAQRRFDRALRYQHSFWYRPAQEVFGEALKADPDCAIAHWGIALGLLGNPHFAPPKENLALGLAALEKAKALGAKTQRERDYIDALLAFYAGDDAIPFAQRVQAHLKAVQALAARYADDDEAQIAYAITLNVAASPNDKTYANQLKGAAILEPIFKRQPRHPGVAHYLIHLYDYPPIAEKGLDAAKRYSEIAPAAPHAQHMPSHIFTRVGYWKESIAANSASARAAKDGKEWHDQLHAMDYLVYAHLQLAQDKEARGVVDEMEAVKGYNPNVRTGPMRSRRAAPATWSSAATGAPPQPWRLSRAASPMSMRSPISRARSAPPAPATSRRRGPTSPSSASCATACRAEGHLLGRAGRHPTAGRHGLAAARRGQAGRGSADDRRRGRCRGQDREVDRHARAAGAGARALRHHAARARHGAGRPRRVRGDAREGAEPPRRHDRRRAGRRKARRCREGEAALRQGP